MNDPHPARERAARILLAVALLWTVAVTAPGLFDGGVFPYDSALYVANGLMFESLLDELADFVAGPREWLWTYYEQYPALAVRRHPPLFGMALGCLFKIVGSSVLAAKGLMMTSALILVTAIYTSTRRFLGDSLAGGTAASLAAATPLAMQNYSSIWLDTPALALAFASLSFYAGFLENRRPASFYAYLTLSVAAMYTYPLVVFFIAAVVIHMLATHLRRPLLDRRSWLACSIAIAALLPLVWQQTFLATDNLAVMLGGVPSGWEKFASGYDGALGRSLPYARALAETAPAQALGLLLWLGVAARRGASAAELTLLGAGLSALAYDLWIPVGNPRYLLYAVMPWTPLAVIGLRAALLRARPVLPLSPQAACATVAALAAAYAVAARRSDPTISLAPVASEVLATSGEERILYSGALDAAFVMYARLADGERRSHLFRSRSQISSADDLGSFVSEHRVDTVVLENSTASRTPLLLDFTRAAATQLAGNRSFATSAPLHVHDSAGALSEFAVLRRPDTAAIER